MSYQDKPSYKKQRGNAVLVQYDNVDKALRKFKKRIMESGLLNELREREFYEKPTTERKRKKSQAKRRWARHLSSQQLPKKLY
jgi:small subunit ribosomal protein S21